MFALYDQYADEHSRIVLLAISGIGLLLIFFRRTTLTEPITALFKFAAIAVLAGLLGFIWSFASNKVLVFLGHPSAATPEEDCRIIGVFGAVMVGMLSERMSNLGDLLCDILYSEGSCADQSKLRKLPSLIMLQQLRQRGYVRKAYSIARRHLWNEARTFAYWIFAAETAVCLRDYVTARRIVARLCRCSAFSTEQKEIAVRQLGNWFSRCRKQSQSRAAQTSVPTRT
jgi:hypothetical protein